MDLRNPHRFVLIVTLIWLSSFVLPKSNAQPLPFYKSEKILVGDSWVQNINANQQPRFLKSARLGYAYFTRSGSGYLLHYNNYGIAEYDTIVFTAGGEIQAYALKNQFLRAGEDYFIATPGSISYLDVLDDDDSYTSLRLSGIPFEEGIYASVSQGKIRLETSTPGLYHLYYTICDGSGNCDEEKVTVFVMDLSKTQNIITLSEVTDQQLTLPLPDASYELVSSTIDYVYPDGEGFFDVNLFPRNYGDNEILFRNGEGKTLLYRINYMDKWCDNKLNTSDKVYLHPGKAVEFTLTNNDFWPNIYTILPTSSDIKVTKKGSGRVQILPKAGFLGKTSFQYVTCAFPNCDTTTVDVYVDHFKPAKDQFDIFVDPSVAYDIPFYTPVTDYQFSIIQHPTQGTLEVTLQGHGLKYTPGSGFGGEDIAKVKYSYQNGSGTYSSTHYIRFLPSPYSFHGSCTSCVWPGDTDGNGIVELEDIGPIARYIGEKGPVRPDGDLWKGQWSYPWMNFENDKLNHYDADGDGLISSEDLQVIVDYYGRTHGLYAKSMVWMGVPVEIVMSKKSVTPGEEMVIEFIVGDEDNKLYNVTGFSADLKIEGQDLSPDDVHIMREESQWLKSYQPTMTLKTAGKVEGQVTAGEYRVRSVGVKGYGKALKVSIIVEDEVEGFRTLRAKSNGVKFYFRNMKIHTGKGVIHLPDQEIELPLKPADATPDQEPDQPEVFPNPAHDKVSLHWPDSENKMSLEILDLTGKHFSHHVWNTKVNSAHIPVGQLSPGLYILRWRSGDKTWNQKLSVIN